MPKLSPQEIAAKAASRASAAAPDYLKGVQRVTTAPGASAAQKKTKYVAGVNESADRWARNVAKVSLSEWQAAVEAKSSRYAQGVAAAAPKIEEFWSEFGPVQDRIVAAASQMPDDTVEQRIQKAVFVMQQTSKFKRGGGGS